MERTSDDKGVVNRGTGRLDRCIKWSEMYRKDTDIGLWCLTH